MVVPWYDSFREMKFVRSGSPVQRKYSMVSLRAASIASEPGDA
jgi:hypothetical protein